MKLLLQKAVLLNKVAPIFFVVSLLLLFVNTISAQCPDNIDFENGNFAGWQCYKSIFPSGGKPIEWKNPIPPEINGHVMFPSPLPGDSLDYYGDFPKLCPNGSRHSIRLGNEQAGASAERVSYTFTIPSGQNKFSLIYNYAIVLEDFGHPVEEQPRFMVEVFNITDSIVDQCSSLSFIVTGGLPGFFKSTKRNSSIVPVWCKDWASASINLDGMAGKTFRISFSATDCAEGLHFGYAYLDVNTQCRSSFFNDYFCNTNTEANVNAPFGYQSYTWLDSTLTKVLGTEQLLTIKPKPPSGTRVSVVLVPYSGYGCRDTLTTQLFDTLTVVAHAGNDISSCNAIAVQLGASPNAGFKYAWTPATGLSDPSIANPVATTTVNMQYILTTTRIDGGCMASDTVLVLRPCKDSVYVPNVFTPNNDGVNDVLRPLVTGFAKVMYFKIYNRMGQLLFTSNSSSPVWDGKINGMPAGLQTVVWIVGVMHSDGKVYQLKGSTLVMH